MKKLLLAITLSLVTSSAQAAIDPCGTVVRKSVKNHYPSARSIEVDGACLDQDCRTAIAPDQAKGKEVWYSASYRENNSCRGTIAVLVQLSGDGKTCTRMNDRDMDRSCE